MPLRFLSGLNLRFQVLNGTVHGRMAPRLEPQGDPTGGRTMARRRRRPRGLERERRTHHGFEDHPGAQNIRVMPLDLGVPSVMRRPGCCRASDAPGVRKVTIGLA
jgi:hypothetical protein